jgi:hypothetical protein
MILASKINIIIPAHPNYYFPPLRYLLIACKKKFIMSTSHVSYVPFVQHKHFKMFSDYKYWVNRKDERQKFTNEVYNDLKINYNYTNALKPALEHI